MTTSREMTTGPALPLILNFTLPLLLGNLLQQTYSLVDAAIVGQFLGIDALAGVGASSSVIFLILGFCNGCCCGFGIPVAQRFGARDYADMRRYVANALRLLGLPEDLKALVEDNRLTAGHARAILSLSDEDARWALAQQIMDKALSVRQAEEVAKKLNRAKKPAPLPEKDPTEVDYAALAALDLGKQLGRKVKIVSGKRKGRLELEYYGVDDLNDLLDALKALPART